MKRFVASYHSWKLVLVGSALLLLVNACSYQPVEEPLDLSASSKKARVYFNDNIKRFDVDFLEIALTDANTADDKFLRMVKDAGGFEAYEALRLSDRAKYQQLLKKHNIEYVTDRLPGVSESEEGLSLQNVDDCVKYFPQSDRDKLFFVGDGVAKLSGIRWPAFKGKSHEVYIDKSGRPAYASDLYGQPGVVSAPSKSTISRSCQDKVRSWGISGDQAGHLIASALGGWKGRANLAPQNGNFNNTSWRRIENKAKECATGERFYYRYTTYPLYPDNKALRPNWFVSRSTATRYRSTSNPAYFARSTTYFPNISGGGTNGTEIAQQVQQYWDRYCR